MEKINPRSLSNREKRRRSSSNNMERLTQDLLIDILSRLPIGSLLRASCVSKTWLTTITSDPRLSTLQLKRSNSFSTNDAILLTIPNISSSGYRKLYFSENPNLDSPLFTKEIDLSFIPSFQQLSLYVLGVCNGLLCLATLPRCRRLGTSQFPVNLICKEHDSKSERIYNPIAKPIFVLNPITGEHRQLPDFEISGSVKPTHVKYGFGFDDCRKAFKVVVFLGNPDTDIMSEMQVYTIGVGGNNVWRREVGNFPKEIFYSDQMILDTYFNGVLYWIASTTTTTIDNLLNCYDGRTNIMSFHLGSEDVEVMQPPEVIAVRSYHLHKSDYTLGVVNDSLCFLDVKHIDDKMEMWIRKNENGTTHWIKHFSIYKSVIIAPGLTKNIVLINYAKNGELLLFCHKRLITYNVESNTSKFVEIGGVEELEGIGNVEAFSFAGSLTSIDMQA